MARDDLGLVGLAIVALMLFAANLYMLGVPGVMERIFG